MTLRLGLLGTARISPKAAIAPANKLPGVEIAAVAARDPSRAERFAAKHGIPKVHPDYMALIRDPHIDAIYNPLPNHLHGLWTVAALKAGKHVLCEKPLAANAQEAATIAQTATATGRICMEAFHYRYHPAFLRMESLIARGTLGPLLDLEAHFCTPLLRLGDIRYRYDLAGGALMDLGCYTVHMLRTLARSEPRVITAQARRFGPTIDRRMDAELCFDASPHAQADGVVAARLRCSMLSSTLLRVILVARCAGGEIRLWNPVVPHYFHRLRIRQGDGWETEHFPGPTSYDYQMVAFAEAVETGRPPLTHAHDGHANMQVIDNIYRLAGLPLRFPAPQE